GTIHVPAGVSSFHMTFPTVDDSVVETDETLRVLIGSKEATATISDNDALLVQSVTGSATMEGNYARVTVTLNHPASGSSDWTLQFDNSTAESADYNLNGMYVDSATNNGDGTVTVPSDTTEFVVWVPIVNDLIDESDGETFTLTVNGVGGSD